MRKQLPNYPIDGEAIYIPETDDAWNHEKIRQEKEDHPDVDHPYDVYRRGDTRCRLDPVSAYYDPDKKPEKWYLKPLPPSVLIDCNAYTRQMLPRVKELDGRYVWDAEVETLISKRALLAMKHGIKKVENWNFPFDFQRNPDGTVSDDTITNLQRMAPGLVDELGSHVLISFAPLKEDEGK